MEDIECKNGDSKIVILQGDQIPPSPPYTEDALSDDSATYDDLQIPLPPPTIAPTTVLDIDKCTPDAHVPRDPRLIRLTGTHPLNVEAPLSALFDEGFLTSQELFYVRNHGPVPKVEDPAILDWEFSVEGLVENSMAMTLRELMIDYEQITCPVTLVCAGNRRKEQNLVRQSKGFSWGAAGVSTALFTGVFIGDLIKKARPRKGAKYICMEGADKLPHGFYGTSVKLNWAIDPNRGMMLAYKMNGEMLRPDHGKPLRAVIPGQIGGRSVKWLKKLVITGAPSDNWYHINDNRVLPTMISPEESAQNHDWWRDDRYAIYDLSTNSAIIYPAHDEKISWIEGPQTYRARGYAYGGGGRRVTRVELSLDQGISWRLAKIDYPEDRYRDVEQNMYGGRLDMSWRETCFCWCFWALDIPLSDLANAKDLVVRAMDESMNIQPKEMYWSVLGMMNNPWFRVKISREDRFLWFEHPTQPALIPGGWMQKVKDAGGNLMDGHWGETVKVEEEKAVIKEEKRDVVMTKEGVNKIITLDELKSHDDNQDPWFVINGEVYEGTSFLEEHPGGPQSIIGVAGLDCSNEFLAIHSETAKSMMQTHHLGTLDETSKLILKSNERQVKLSDTFSPTFLSPRSWKSATLHAKQAISWDTRIFTFQLESEDQMLGLPKGQHLVMRVWDPVNEEAVIRPYTPLPTAPKKGYVDILIKLYFATQDAIGGRMSLVLDRIPIGNAIELKGPIGKFEYLGNGSCSIKNVRRKIKRFGMICAGSGITPIYQILHAVVNDPEDFTRCIMLNGNRTIEDILCKEGIDLLITKSDGRAKVVYTLTQATNTWSGLRGRIDQDLIREYCEKDDSTLILVCGPKDFENSVRIALEDQGWSKEQVVFF